MDQLTRTRWADASFSPPYSKRTRLLRSPVLGLAFQRLPAPRHALLRPARELADGPRSEALTEESRDSSSMAGKTTNSAIGFCICANVDCWCLGAYLDNHGC